MKGMEQEPTPSTTCLGELATGEKVFDRPKSHIHEDAALAEYLPQALERIKSNEREFFMESVDFKEAFGRSRCVETTEEDEIVYAQRVGRRGSTRFVKGCATKPTSELTVVLKKAETGGYIVITAFWGPKPEPEPWDPHATEASEAYWQKHALVWGTEEVVPGTEMSEQEYFDSIRESA